MAPSAPGSWEGENVLRRNYTVATKHVGQESQEETPNYLLLGDARTYKMFKIRRVKESPDWFVYLFKGNVFLPKKSYIENRDSCPTTFFYSCVSRGIRSHPGCH